MRSLFLVVLAAAGCSQTPKPMDSGTTCMEAGTAMYPPGPYGNTQRMGTTPGDRIQNFSFQGYLNLDPKTKTMKGALQTIKLSDFYDPEAKKYRIIHLITSAGWCGPCIQETQCLAMAGGATETLGTQGVVIIQALMEGVATGAGSTQTDLDDWIMKYSPNFTEVLDPEAANLGVFSTASAVPFSVTIDARSMEILARDKSFTSCPSVQSEVQTQVAWTMNNAPLSNCP